MHAHIKICALAYMACTHAMDNVWRLEDNLVKSGFALPPQGILRSTQVLRLGGKPGLAITSVIIVNIFIEYKTVS